MKDNQKRKVCFPIMNRAHYARQKLLLKLLASHPRLNLQLVMGGSALLEKYAGRSILDIEKSGFLISEQLFNVIEGGNHVAMAKTASLIGLEFSNTLQRLNPDIVIIRGDRFEQLATAMAAAYMNKTIVHIEGGDITGTIDESVRHAITKLAHIHFVSNEGSRRRVIKMGENPRYVFNVGSLDVEFAVNVSRQATNELVSSAIGVGSNIDVGKPFLMVIHHPVTTEKNHRAKTELLLNIITGFNMPVIWFWPNNDAGSNEISKAIRDFREKNLKSDLPIKFITNLAPEDFTALLKRASCLIGNSSAGIKECSYFGIPAINIGDRQGNRLRGYNVLDVDWNQEAIKESVIRQLNHGPYPTSRIYYKPNTSKRIVSVLSKLKLYTQKKFYE